MCEVKPCRIVPGCGIGSDADGTRRFQIAIEQPAAIR